MIESSDRIDKFLWSVRVFKTRSQAGEACKKGQVFIQDSEVKPSRLLKIGDIIQVRKSGVYYTYRVIGFPPSRVGAKLLPDYIKDETTPEELAKLQAQKEPGFIAFRPRGTGRPTKKERRDIDKLTDAEW